MWCYLSSLVLTKYHHAYALFASINVQNLPIWMLKFNSHTISDGKQKRWNCLVSQMIVSLFIESAKFLRKMSGKMIDIFILRHIIGPNCISLPNSNRILYRPKNVSHSHIFFQWFLYNPQKTPTYFVKLDMSKFKSIILFRLVKFMVISQLL